MRKITEVFLLITMFHLMFHVGTMGQHQVITSQGDTLNCAYVEVDLEMEEVICQQSSNDSVLVFNPDLVTAINYHFYPKYTDIKHPSIVAYASIGIITGTYTSAFGNIETQPILADGLKRGADYSVGVQYFRNSIFGLAMGGNIVHFKNKRDTVWAQESFFTGGLGVAYISKSVFNEIFFSGEALLTYSDYKTKGEMPSFSFSEQNQLWGLQTSATVNYHIAESLLMCFTGKLHFLNKQPDQTGNVTNINLALLEMNMGFRWMW